MLKLNKISKSYTTGTFTQKALKEVSLSFRTNEFVAILGASGSGKTTLLNIIGGLDRYDSGDLVINGKSTKKFKDADWDAYRNNCVGFIFQSYNLITHISVLNNVEMCMTLSGISKSAKRRRAMEALKKVGLKEHAHKKPNQLSGGQMQRVAIARALVNNPDIILADEPTGALDSKTSVQIMELIKEIAKDKLVIMVSHNKELASEYATRIVDLKDGELVGDSHPVKKSEEDSSMFNIKKTSMNFLTALSLSFNNIKTKIGRTLLTAFASSIGIIGIALILSLSNGFDKKIAEFEQDSLSSMPIIISQSAVEMDENTMRDMFGGTEEDEGTYPNDKKIYPKAPVTETITHNNVLNKEYIDYLKNIDLDLISGLSFTGSTNLNIITKNSSDKYLPISNTMYVFGQLPQKPKGSDNRYEFMENTYDLLEGTYPTTMNELVLIVDSKNTVSTTLLETLGYDSTADEINFKDIIGKELKLISNNNFYTSLGKIYTYNTDYEELYNSSESITLKIAGIIRGKEGKEFITSFSSGVGYTEELIDYVLETNNDSDIVKAQKKADYNIMTTEIFENDFAKEQTLTYLGENTTPMVIQIFAKDFETKDEIIEYLDDYNKDKKDEDKIVYSDYAEMLSSLSGNIMNAITYVLVAFSAISLIVSTIMIAIITYISVLERTKEIGILRALGARKKDITRVFNAETFIIGLTSGSIGIIIAYLLTFPANFIIEKASGLGGVAVLNPIHALFLIVISLALTLLGGFIPAKIASKKDPVEALRTE